MSNAPLQRETSHRPYRSGLYWKLLASFAVLSLAAIALLTWLFSRSYESLLARELDDRLNVAAVTAEQLLVDRWPTDIDAKVQALVQAIGRRTRVRLTLINAKGHVLADSDEPNVEGVAGMEPHGNRLEVVEALHAGSGGARRKSPTMNETQQYFAVRVGPPDAPQGVVRVSYPTRSIDDEIAAFARGLAITGGLTALAAIAATAWITALATRPLRDLAAAADALLAGKYDHRLPVASPNGDELGALSRALTEASQRLERGERQLRSTTQTQATILEGMSESVIAVGRDEHVLFANNSAGRLLGFRPEKVEGLPLLEAVRSHELREAVQRALRTKQLANSELTWRTGTARTFDVLATPLPGDPCPGVVLVLRDISEVKRLERMRQQFIANVSHELKTPLSSIKAYTETLLGGAQRRRSLRAVPQPH
jgi:two-component system phosphate regulon sensor histidine kinase PhoR